MSQPLQSALLIVFAIFLVFLNGFFVAAEFAIVKVRATRIEELAAKGRFGAAKARDAIRHLDAYLSATQLGITLASLGLGYIGEPAFAHIIEGALGDAVSPATRHAIAFGVAFTLITALHIVIGELAPKSLAIQRAEAVTLAIIYPLDFFYKIFKLPIAALNGIASLVLKPFGLSPAGEHGGTGGEAHSEDELRMILDASHRGGEINQEELNLVNQVFAFSRQQAREIMVPRPDVTFLSTGRSIAENSRAAEEANFTRFPLAEGDSPDEVIGMIHVKDLLALSRQESPEPDAVRLRRIARTLPRIPETKPIDQLLREFQQSRQHVAVVVDEYGGTAGIVTLEDIVEEIVGDIQDEFDRTSPEMEPAGEDCYHVDARMSLSKMERVLNIAGPAEETEVDTIGGWVLAARGNGSLRPGDTLSYGEATISVTEMVGRRVRKVRICVPEGKGTGNSSTGAGGDAEGVQTVAG